MKTLHVDFNAGIRNAALWFRRITASLRKRPIGPVVLTVTVAALWLPGSAPVSAVIPPVVPDSR